jgi:hypothetical protein
MVHVAQNFAQLPESIEGIRTNRVGMPNAHTGFMGMIVKKELCPFLWRRVQKRITHKATLPKREDGGVGMYALAQKNERVPAVMI